MDKIPEGYHSITPHFIVDGAAQAIERYKAAFGAETKLILPRPGSDKIMHGELLIGNSMMFVADPAPGADRAAPPSGAVSSGAFYHYVDDVDSVYAHAISIGMTGVSAPEDMFWGDRVAAVKDIDGNTWKLVQAVRDVSPEEMEAAMEAMRKAS